MLKRLVATTALFCFLLVIQMSRAIGVLTSPLLRPGRSGGLRVLAIGTFYHRNWYESHLKPLSLADSVESLLVVTDEEGVELDGIDWSIAPRWLRRTVGMHGSRMIWSLMMVRIAVN